MSIFTAKEPEMQNRESENAASGQRSTWLVAGTWIIAALMILLAAFSLYQYFTGKSLLAFVHTFTRSASNSQVLSSMPAFAPTKSYDAVERSTEPDTILPEGLRGNLTNYEVSSGDSLFGIAKNFDLEPESVLWANTNTMHDDPHFISVGAKLKIPPTDGILYEWQEGDKLDHIAGLYHVDVEDILLFPGNDIDMTNPVIEPGSFIMIPGGWRPLQPWTVPMASSDVSGGTTAIIKGPGSCSPTATAYGTYSFVWPAPYFGEVSGNDYWAGHPAIDCKCYEGDGIVASDSGVVIYSGWIDGGYGNMVAVDHMNGYVTIYAHLSANYPACGSVVTQGTPIGACGSTGNSTGAHLHFEIRKDGGYENPWYVLQ